MQAKERAAATTSSGRGATPLGGTPATIASRMAIGSGRRRPISVGPREKARVGRCRGVLLRISGVGSRRAGPALAA